MTLTAGARLGTYEIVGPLGAGGMGEVYRARDTKLQREVALKILPDAFASDAERRERFEREARTIAALNHPNIVTVYSVESTDAALFLTMELVEGKPLSDLMPEHGIPIAQVLKLMIPLADAVSAAHQRGITHRDLKPANVMVTVDGRVKVLDFGLAKLREEEQGHATVLPTQGLTGEGRIVGTVAYMSPEQAEGKPVDQRSDIFSLGILLYELASGRRPFTGDTSASVMASIIKDSPASITDVKASLPGELARIVKRSLVKDPEHRYQTAKDFRNELEALKDDIDSGVVSKATPTTPAASALPGGRRGWMAGALAAGAAALTAFAYIALKDRPSKTPMTPVTFDAIKLTRLTSTGKATFAAISPDGKYVVHVVDDAGQQSLWMRQTATTSNVQIVPPADVRYDGVVFAPDGNYVYYSTYPSPRSGGNVATLFQVPVLGGTPRRVLDDIDSPPTFSPDGKRFAFLKGFQTAGESALMLAGVDGSNVRRLATSKVPDSFPLTYAAWSPDGKVIAVPMAMTSDGQRGVRAVAVDTATGALTPVGSRRWDGLSSVAWLGVGRGLAMTAVEGGGSPQLWYQPYPTGEARRITNDLNNYDQVSVTADSSALVTVQGNRESHLWVVSTNAADRAVEITSGIGRFDASPTWTPDGKLVYVSTASGNPDIWISDADGSNARQLTTDAAADDFPTVTADGKTIVFQSNRNGLHVWKMDIDGGNPMQLTKTPSVAPVVSPDGRWVYFTEVSGQQRSIWKVSLAGGNAIRVFGPRTPPDDDPAVATLRATFATRAISPDGTLLAGSFLDRQARGFKLGFVSTTSGEFVKKLDDTLPGSVAFAADGRSMTFVDLRNGVMNVWNRPLDGGPAKPLTNFTTGSIFGIAWSRDGRQLAVAKGLMTSDVVLVSNLPSPAR